MPISKSAEKSLATSKKKQAMNKVKVIELEKSLKKVSASNVSLVISKIDKAAKTHIISQNKAGRMKSRLTKKFGTPKVAKTAAKPVVKKAVSKKAAPKKTAVKKTSK